METKLTSPASKRSAANHENDVLRIHEGRVIVVPGQQWLGAGGKDNKHATLEEQKLSYRCLVNSKHPDWKALPHNILNGSGCSTCSAQRNSDSAGKRRTPRASEDEKQKAREMVASGMTRQQVADALGRSSGTIVRWCNPEITERQRLKSAQWREENRERLRAIKRRYISEFEHGKANSRASKATRRARKLDWWTNDPDDIAAMQAIYLECERLNRETKIEHHVDHIWPLSLGGPHLPWNLQIITAEENLSKGNSYSSEDQAEYIKRIADLFDLH